MSRVSLIFSCFYVHQPFACCTLGYLPRTSLTSHFQPASEILPLVQRQHAIRACTKLQPPPLDKKRGNTARAAGQLGETLSRRTALPMGCTDSRQHHHHQHGHGSYNRNSKGPDGTASSTTKTSLSSISTRNFGDFTSDASHTSGSSLSMSQEDWRRRPLSGGGGGEEGDYHQHHGASLSMSPGDGDDHASPCGINYPPSASGGAFASFDVTLGGSSSAGVRIFHENMSLAELSDVAPLDHGGFCVVCSCTYRGQRAVLKVPKPQGPEGAAADLLTEIAIYKRVSEQGGHPNIAHAYGSGFHLQQGKQTPFLVLERLDGGSLAKALERSRRAGYDTWSDPVGRLPVALELADALAFLHNEAVPGGFVLHR